MKSKILSNLFDEKYGFSWENLILQLGLKGLKSLIKTFNPAR